MDATLTCVTSPAIAARTGRRVVRGLLTAWLTVAFAACAADPPDAHTSAAASGVEIIASGCSPVSEVGSGTAIGGPLVLTVAHVVAGAKTVGVRVAGLTFHAVIAGIDTQHDLAILRVDGIDRSPVELRSAVADETGSYLGFGGLAPGVKPFTVKRRITLDSEDIYINGDYPRAGFELTSDTVAGDSGAGLIVGGAVTGVVWARSEQADTRAYAIDISEFRSLLAEVASSPVDAVASAVRCT